MNQEKFEEAYIRSNAQLAFVIAEISGSGVFAAAERRPDAITTTDTGDTKTIRTRTRSGKPGSSVTRAELFRKVGVGVTNSRGNTRYWVEEKPKKNQRKNQ